VIGYYKSEDSRIFFLFPSSSSLVAKKQKILLLVFSDEPRGENNGRLKKSKKKLHTVTIYFLNCAREESHQLIRENNKKFSSFFFFLFFRRHLVLTTIRVLDRQNKLSLTKMKRLFGVKKTVEAPSLEETTGKVILLSSFRLLLCLCLLFSFLVAHPSKLIHFSSSNTTQNKLN